MSLDDAQKLKMLRHQNEDLKERLANLYDIKTRFDGLFNIFTLLKDGFVMMRDEYRRLQSDNPSLPTWEEMLKRAAAKSGKPLPLEGDRSSVTIN